MSFDPVPRLSTGAGGPPPPVAAEFRYSQTEGFVALLRGLNASLFVSTYQANKLLIARALPGGLSTLVRTFDRPMGIAADASRLALGTRGGVWHFRNAPDIARQVEPVGQHDACYLPRSHHVTGDISIHELTWVGDELWAVNTRFSCLCTFHPDYSFVPRWRPPFVSALAAEDRCHLNGLCIADGAPRYATALGETDSPQGWRAAKACGGCLIDVRADEVILRGLSMPHSPRLHDGRLWLLESGTGELHIVDRDGRRTAVAGLPGFARGLVFSGPHAFVGLSKIRPTTTMDGVPLAARRHELKCGVAAVDLRSGRVEELLEFHSAVEEIFDVQVVAGVRFPEIMGFQKESVHHTFVTPAAATGG
jgi:uncharacterized protein (TIGR03032 family)